MVHCAANTNGHTRASMWRCSQNTFASHQRHGTLETQQEFGRATSNKNRTTLVAALWHQPRRTTRWALRQQLLQHSLEREHHLRASLSRISAVSSSCFCVTYLDDVWLVDERLPELIPNYKHASSCHSIRLASTTHTHKHTHLSRTYTQDTSWGKSRSAHTTSSYI